MCSSMKALSRFCSSFTRGEYSKSMVMLLCSSFQNFFHLRPGELREQGRAGAGVARVFARGRAVHHPLRDALADGGDAEEVVGHVIVPDRGRDALAAGALEVHVHV